MDGADLLGAGRRLVPRTSVSAREASLAELARRYLAAFAPATQRDFAYWAGLPLGDCRLGLEAIASEIREVSLDPGESLLAPKGWRPTSPRRPIIRLLGAYDTYLMGYVSRSHAVSPERERKVLPGGGILRPTICVDGQFVGTWASAKSAKKVTVTLEPFGRLEDSWLGAIEAEAADIARFEGVAEGVVGHTPRAK